MTYAEVYESCLTSNGFLQRVPYGRIATDLACEHPEKEGHFIYFKPEIRHTL
jgi:Holliday junction resolvasome RuvABC ATP-dependent DNA helicase subunit